MPASNSDFSTAKQVIAATRHFSALPAEVTEALARQMILRVYTAGQVICLEGEPGEYVYLLEKGWVKGVRTALDGREQAALFLHDGELFGDEAVFSGAAYPMTVVALEKISAWAIEGAALVDLSRRYPALALACLEHLSARILYYVQLVEDLGLRSVQARIAHTLLNHAELRDGVLIVPRRSWTTLDEMATRLGTVRDVLSRSLNVLETEGILHLERSQIVILDPQKLLERGKA
ncbi:MAG: Crp/Fnr family transcriptional regulator [Chloroflexi bacterium]|nr:Crp/Fnr family transcriptional regulator [Chloroflexota bacterium]